MRLSDEKISHLTHVVFKALLEKEIITPLAEESDIRREIKRVIVKELKIAEDIDSLVKTKLHSYSRKIPEGSPEWEVLYQKFFHEEATKKGRT
ncbi:MAG: hypothetical protein A3J72_06200 [Nitrospirae bacterium RIFCSPHIGHO2_02_FULL_40_19]|nr:MAG: hypothetical protein A3J72_06200 [Nitrospirae bacterium RIFCSPHIGHO2_02_FULL_40_19]